MATERLRREDRRQVLIPDDIWIPVNAIAKSEGVSASAIVRKASREYVRKRRAELRRQRKAGAVR